MPISRREAIAHRQFADLGLPGSGEIGQYLGIETSLNVVGCYRRAGFALPAGALQSAETANAGGHGRSLTLAGEFDTHGLALQAVEITTDIAAQILRTLPPIGIETAFRHNTDGIGMRKNDALPPDWLKGRGITRIDGMKLDTPGKTRQRLQQTLQQPGVGHQDRRDLRLRRPEYGPAPQTMWLQNQGATHSALFAVQTKALAALGEVFEQRTDESTVEIRMTIVQLVVQAVPVGRMTGERGGRR